MFLKTACTGLVVSDLSIFPEECVSLISKEEGHYGNIQEGYDARRLDEADVNSFVVYFTAAEHLRSESIIKSHDIAGQIACCHTSLRRRPQADFLHAKCASRRSNSAVYLLHFIAMTEKKDFALPRPGKKF